MTPPHDILGWSDCDISWSFSLTFCKVLTLLCCCQFPSSVLIHIRTKVKLKPLYMSKPISIFAVRSKALVLLWILLLCAFHVCLCYDVLSVPCSLVVTCWTLLRVVFSCVYGAPGHVWYLIVLIPNLCLRLCF